MADDDYKLLENYTRLRSDAAFEALSRHYVDLVYSSALRLTGDRHQAEDVTQAVFLVLAQKAAQLQPPIVLPAWLLSVTRMTAANLRRSESTQRKGRKAVINAHEATRIPPSADWEDIAPFLDDALDGLDNQERDAITLRYFQQSSLEEVGRHLGVSADAARKRLDRALKKLRRFFAKKGVTVGAVALPALISTYAVRAAPAEVAAALPAIVAAAQAGTYAGPSLILSKGTLQIMAATATKKVILLCAACLSFGLLGGALVIAAYKTPAAPVAPSATPATLLPAMASPGPASVVPASPAPAMTVVAAHLPRVDLLSKVDVAADAINGVWTLDNGALRSGENAYARVQFPYVPPEEYDFTIEFTVDVVREDVVMILYKNGVEFCWKMGMASNRFCAFEYIGSVKNPDQCTRQDMDRVFRNKQRCKATVQVRNGGVAAYMDDKLIANYTTNYRDLHQAEGWNLGTRGCLGIGAHLSKVTVHTAEVTEVLGLGKNLRKEGEAAPPRSIHKLLADEQWAKAIDLMPLINPQKDAVVGIWSKDGATLSCDALPLSRLEIPYRPPEEYDFKIVFSRAKAGKDLHQFVSQGTKSFQWCLNAWRTYKSLASFQAFDRYGEYWNTSTAKLAGDYNPGQLYTSIVQVRKKSCAAYLDGILVTEFSGGYNDARVLKDWRMPTPGLLGLGSSGAETTFHKIEIVEVTGKGTVTPTNPSKEPPPPAINDLEQPTKPPKPSTNAF